MALLASAIVVRVAPCCTCTAIKLFFLGCVSVAGICGALTVNRRILWVKALPGLTAAAR